MCQVIAYKRLKTMKNYNAVTSEWSWSLMRGGRLQDGSSYHKGFDWEKIGVWNRQSKKEQD